MTGSSLEQESDSCENTFIGSGASWCVTISVMTEGKFACTELLLQLIGSIKVFALTYHFLSADKYGTDSQILLTSHCWVELRTCQVKVKTASNEPDFAKGWTNGYQ